jgi:hypothetical protein
MGNTTQKIREIQQQEGLTLLEVFKKYPHLAEEQYRELQEEKAPIRERKILCD